MKNKQKKRDFTFYTLIFLVFIGLISLAQMKLDLLKLESLPYLSFFGGTAALLFAIVLIDKVLSYPYGNDKMAEISGYIQEGAMAFLGREYKILFFFVLALFLLLVSLISVKTGVCFLAGSLCSALAGFVGMFISTRANARTAQAATRSLNKALKVAFFGGTVTGMTVVGLGLVGVSILYLVFKDTAIISGFALGGSSIALFARVGGGIYTKAADIGADMVGKVEARIPEDDLRNPAVIADNVGDNVGDVAGMGADLFESFVGSLIAAITLGFIEYGTPGAVLPLLIAASGVLASIIGVLTVRSNAYSSPMKSLHKGAAVAAVLMLVFSFFIIGTLISQQFSYNIFFSVLVGLVLGIFIAYTTEYYTSAEYKHVKKIVEFSQTGGATNIIAGLGVGMLSTFMLVIFISIAILLSYLLSGMFGIAMASVGMLAIAGIIAAIDAYGPISDNAGGIAQMTSMDPSVREITDKLDAVGNTTAAIGKGFAIGSGTLTSLALLTAFTKLAGLSSIDILKPMVIVGLFFGASLPFVFSAFTMDAVGKAASKMVDEVRRQFRETAGIMEGTAKPDYAKCVDISTKAALEGMVLPGSMAVIIPLLFGVAFKAEALGGMLAGAIVSGVCLATMMANAGGAWDNAKKFIETGYCGGRGGESHCAAVIGDTVGDPCKDTSGPSLNILLKLMTIVSLVFVSLFI